jgi:putative spermidine/putrescine transport system permease protein
MNGGLSNGVNDLNDSTHKSSRSKGSQQWIPYLLASPVFLWLTIFFLVPIFFLIVMSFRGYSPTKGIMDQFTTAHYVKFLTDSFYLGILYRSIKLSVLVTLISLILGYPEAYYLTIIKGKKKALFLALILSPLFVSAVIRTFGWMIILAPHGLINSGLDLLGLIREPVKFMYSEKGIVIGLVHVLMPYMVLSIYSSLINRNMDLEKAAQSLGAHPVKTFFKITLPLSLPGILAGTLIVLTLSVSAFITPAMLGGTRVRVVPFVTYEQFMVLLNWPFGSVAALVLLAITVGIVMFYHRALERGRWAEVFR